MGVDFLFAYFIVGISSEHVAVLLPRCLDDVSELLHDLLDPTLTSVLAGDALQKRIKVVRAWDAEVQKEDPVWSVVCTAQYKAEFVNTMLDHCDTVYVALQAMIWSARRCNSRDTATTIFREVISSALMKNVQSYAKFTSMVLLDASTSDNAGVLHTLSAGTYRLTPHLRPAPNPHPLKEELLNKEEVSHRGFSLSDQSDHTIATNCWSISVDLEMSSPAKSAAASALMSATWTLRWALQRIEVLLREQAFYATSFT